MYPRTLQIPPGSPCPYSYIIQDIFRCIYFLICFNFSVTLLDLFCFLPPSICLTVLVFPPIFLSLSCLEFLRALLSSSPFNFLFLIYPSRLPSIPLSLFALFICVLFLSVRFLCFMFLFLISRNHSLEILMQNCPLRHRKSVQTASGLQFYVA